MYEQYLITSFQVRWLAATLVFTITAEIPAHSLANFYICGQIHEFKIHATRQRARAGNSAICYHKKQIDGSFLNASVLLLIMNFVIILSK